jgi:hypothetical protein
VAAIAVAASADAPALGGDVRAQLRFGAARAIVLAARLLVAPAVLHQDLDGRAHDERAVPGLVDRLRRVEVEEDLAFGVRVDPAHDLDPALRARRHLRDRRRAVLVDDLRGPVDEHPDLRDAAFDRDLAEQHPRAVAQLEGRVGQPHLHAAAAWGATTAGSGEKA